MGSPYKVEAAYVKGVTEFNEKGLPGVALEPVESVREGQLKETHEEDGHFHRSFSPHQVHVSPFIYESFTLVIADSIADHLPRIKHRLRPIHRFRRSTRDRWFRQYCHCLFSCLQLRMGCVGNAIRDDDRVPGVG